jgi:hypothetical protein
MAALTAVALLTERPACNQRNVVAKRLNPNAAFSATLYSQPPESTRGIELRRTMALP